MLFISTMASFSFLQLCLISTFCRLTFAQLSENFYSSSCPTALSIIENEVKYAIEKEARLGASLLHLHFQDCGIGGCDGSILLDDGEKSSLMSHNIARGFDIIDRVKSQVEKTCPGVVSCADILAVVARDSVGKLGGPSWTVPLGRRDSTEAHKFLASVTTPLFGHLGIDELIFAFKLKGFNKNEFVALQGSHTIGMAQCASYRKHIFEDTNIDPKYAATLRVNCPKQGGDNNTSPIDSTTPLIFDNAYFVNLMKQKGLLASDQALYTGKGGPTDAIVANYSSSEEHFFKDYAMAIVKFGKLGVLTGTKGEIRTNCRKVNDVKG